MPITRSALSMLKKGYRHPPPFPASTGIRSMNGTTHRSWKMRIPTDMRPCGAFISALSIRSFNTIAVLLNATRKPSKIAAFRLW
ncbi:MAG: hypothetical protein U0411_14020 [Thermodesulfovibrionales bacterium]